MIKLTVLTSNTQSKVFYDDDCNLDDIKTKIISQMNNGNTVILGEERDVLVNSSFIETIQIERIADD